MWQKMVICWSSGVSEFALRFWIILGTLREGYICRGERFIAGEREWRKEERGRERESIKEGEVVGNSGKVRATWKQYVLTVIVAITFPFAIANQPCQKRKRQINIVIHNFRLNSVCFFTPTRSFCGAERATAASQSMAGRD